MVFCDHYWWPEHALDVVWRYTYLPASFCYPPSEVRCGEYWKRPGPRGLHEFMLNMPIEILPEFVRLSIDEDRRQSRVLELMSVCKGWEVRPTSIPSQTKKTSTISAENHITPPV